MVTGLCSKEEALMGNMGLQSPLQEAQLANGFLLHRQTLLLDAHLSNCSLGQEGFLGLSCLTTAQVVSLHNYTGLKNFHLSHTSQMKGANA